MINKVTVFEFVTEFNNFYTNVLHLVEEAYNNGRMTRNYPDKVYNDIVEFKNEVERTLEARVLSVDKAGAELCSVIEKFVKLGTNCLENYEMSDNISSYEGYKFFASVVDTYNELCEELGYN